tara:strand:+ start:186 stop:1028 length:843 start_codon:yes stop_codon:yes gene_type:complete
MGYFNTIVKPTIKASEQAANSGVYTTQDVVFDWHAVDIPRGAAKLLGATAIFRQKHGNAGQEFAFDLIYAKSINNTAPSSLGTSNATADGTGYYNNVIGKTTFIAKDYMADILDNGVSIASASQGGADSDSVDMVLECEPGSGTNVGYDKLYVGMIVNDSTGGFDFSTAAEISRAITIADNTGSFVDADVEGTALNLVFAPGDVIHAADDIIIGEIDTVAASAVTFKFNGEETRSETNYTVPANLAAFVTQNGSGTAGDLADGDELYNVNPIKIILHFEK